MAIIKNQNPHDDYDLRKEWEAISCYEENRLKKEFEVLKKIFMYSDNALITSKYSFLIHFYRSCDKDNYMDISIEVERDKFIIEVFSNDEDIKSLIRIPKYRETARTLKQAHDILNHYIGEIHDISRKIYVELPLIDNEDYWENTRKEYYETLEKISNGKVKELYGE